MNLVAELLLQSLQRCEVLDGTMRSGILVLKSQFLKNNSSLEQL